MTEDTLLKEILRGKTLQVYWYLLTHGTKGIREIQKDLKIPSPSSVSYQINKLMKAGIVDQNKENEKYYVKEEIKTGFLGLYIRLGYRMIPRFTLYLIIYLTGIVIFLIVAIVEGDLFILKPINLILLFYIILGIIIFIYESMRIMKTKPV